MQYRVNSPHIISETIQGEVIVIHLETGSYYSLRDSGAEIWNLIEQGARPEDVVEALSARYEGASEEIEASTIRLLEELHAEGLVAPVEADENGRPVAKAEATPSSKRSAFEPPKLEKFTDMQDLILLDPVHEVDARGWPHTAPSDG
jgi:hypothetical protein